MSGIDELLRGLDSIPPSLKLRVHIPPDASFHPIGDYCQKAAALIRELASTVVDVKVDAMQEEVNEKMREEYRDRMLKYFDETSL